MKKSSVFTVIVLALIAAAIFSSHFQAPDPIDWDSFPASEEVLQPTAYRSYYNQLTDYQKAIYTGLLGTIEHAEEKVVFDGVDVNLFKDNAFRAAVAIHYDHPEYFWYRGGYSMDYSYFSSPSDGTVELYPMYYRYVTYGFDAARQKEALLQKVKELAELSRAHSTHPYEQALFVHDHLIRSARYDHEALEEFYRTDHAPACEQIFSAYGCLVEGKTVCSGYAKAFQLVMQELGLECAYVSGKAGESHGWNCLWLNGEGYFIDVTWDDPDFERDEPLYNYMAISSEELARTHDIDMMFDDPVCTAEEYRYFKYFGYYTEQYSFEAVEEIFNRQSDKEILHVQFSSLEELQRAKSDLIDNKRVHKIDAIRVQKKWRYLCNEKHYTLSLIRNS